jgi:hypothetical protein
MKVQDHSFDKRPCVVRVGVIGLVFFGLVSVAISSATLDTLIDATGGFGVAIHQQLGFIQGNPGPAKLAEKTIEFAKAKTAYFRALRAAIPELKAIAAGKTARPPELDRLAEAFSLAGGKQVMVADRKTLVLLERYSDHPGIKKAMTELERAQKVEWDCRQDFDGKHFAQSDGNLHIAAEN